MIESNQSLPSNRLGHIECVRAVFQLLIIAAHIPFLMGITFNHSLLTILRPIYDNATFAFLILSGYLFALRGQHSPFRDFISRKLTTVVGPYLVAFSPVLICLFFFPGVLNKMNPFVGMAQPSPLWVTLLTGRNSLNPALWFFPVITFFFFLTPLFKRLLKSDTTLILACALSFIIAFWGHRPLTTAQAYHSILYFLFPYILGLALFRWSNAFERFFKQFWWGAFTALFAIYFWQSLKMPLGGFDRLSSLLEISWNHIDLGVLNKTLLTLLLFYFFKNGSHRGLIYKTLCRISDLSFGIHLYHFYFVSLILLTWGPIQILNPVIDFVILFVLIFILSYLLCLLIKRINPWFLGREKLRSENKIDSTN